MKFSAGKIPLKPVVLVANNELAKIQSIDHKLKNPMTIIGETHIDNEVNDRILNLEDRIENLNSASKQF